MNPNISILANSINVTERRQGLKVFLSQSDWSSNKELACVFLDDPDKAIFLEITNAILTHCPEKFIPELKLLAVSEEKDIRVKVLNYLAGFESFKGLELLLERAPLEEAILATKLRVAAKKMLEKNFKSLLSQLLSSAGSANEAVRKEAIALFVAAGEGVEIFREFYLYLQGISPSIREKLLNSANDHKAWFISNSLELLKTEQNSNIRLQIVRALEELEHPAIEEVLLEEMKQLDWALRHHVINSLAVLKSEKGKQLLIDAIDDKELAIQAITALDSYGQADIGIIFLRKLGRSGDEVQLALLNGIKNVVTADKRYLEPLMVFAAHEVSKEKAKILTLEIVREICSKTNTPLPEKIAEIEKEIIKLRVGDIPELNLTFSQD